MRAIVLLTLLTGLLVNCKAPSKFDRSYLQYTDILNDRQQVEEVNDSTLRLEEIATSANYGYSASSPVMLGMKALDEGAANRTKYLNALQGPKGEQVTYKRLSSCCAFRTPNAPILKGKQFGLLERYEVRHENSDSPVILYLNIYDQGPLKAPKGFRTVTRASSQR